jgi:hypothetical protein
LSKQFGISDVAFAKRCTAANVPVLGRGYWAKKEAGKRVLQPTLPPRGLGQSDELELDRGADYSQQQDEEELLSNPVLPTPVFPDSLEGVIARAKTIIGKVSRPSFAKPHPVVGRLFSDDERRRQKQAASSYPSFLDGPLFDNPFGKRRLRMVNAIFLTLARASCRVSTRGREANELTAIVGDQPVQFTLGPVKKPPDTYPPKALPADTPLMFEIAWYKPPPELKLLWEDDKDGKLEVRLEEIVTTLLAYGEWMYRHGLRRHYEWRVERKLELEEKMRKERELAERQRRECRAKEAADRRADLLQKVLMWRKATDLRAYVSARLDRASACDGRSQSVEEWANWALAEADAMDPLKS